MIDKKQLGLYWGETAFYFVESDNKGKSIKCLSMPFDTPIESYQSKDIPEGLKYTALIQKAIKQMMVTSPKINLSVPAKDLIFRSFVIPAMQPEEIKNVVDFEAIKYIPIKLEELFYTYHPIPITEDNQKKVRILFTAIRKDILDKYRGVLEHTGLKVESIEPSPVSLVRVLQKKNLLSENVTAIIEIGDTGGRIIITDRQVVHFVREFQLPAPDLKDPAAFSDWESRLFNDIRVSLNFFGRQHPNQKVEKIVTVAVHDIPTLAKNLAEALSVPVNTFNLSTVLKMDKMADIALGSAFGITLRDKGYSSANLDLSNKGTKGQIPGVESKSELVKYKETAITIGACAVAIYLASTLSGFMVSGHKKRLEGLRNQQGEFANSTTEQIQEQTMAITTKLNGYKDIRTKSNLLFYLTKIPQLLPESAWLKNWSVEFAEQKVTTDGMERTVGKPTVSFDGYIYLQNPNEQFRLANAFLSRLRGDKDLTANFKNIDLITVQQETQNGYTVTYFKIVCK